jgi:Holliday junction resolvasome RuvABC endonuclease subunit
MSTIVGIDPGKTGGLSFFRDGKTLEFVMSFKDKDIHNIRQSVFDACNSPTTKIFIENVHVSPQMGVVSAFTFGRYFEVVLSAVMLSRGSVFLVSPQIWQAALGVISKGDKKKLYELAKTLYPKDTKLFNLQTADAVLIGHYGIQRVKYNGGV